MKETNMERDKKLKNLKRPELHGAVKYIPNVIFRVILLIVQYTFKYILLTMTLLTEFKRVYVVSTKRFTGGLGYDHLQQDLGNLSKLPKHMSFVINEDVSTDYCDIANLVVWTIAMGIPYISLYDRHGILKAGESRLGKIIKEKINSLIGSKKAEGIDIILKDSSSRYENGITYPKRFCVQLLSEEDGRTDILDTAKRISCQLEDSKIKESDIDIGYVNNSLKATENIPDPELVVQFGSIYTLSGFLPWQTRLAEILNIRTYKNMTYDRFYEILQKFSKCNQRFGK